MSNYIPSNILIRRQVESGFVIEQVGILLAPPLPQVGSVFRLGTTLLELTSVSTDVAGDRWGEQALEFMLREPDAPGVSGAIELLRRD